MKKSDSTMDDDKITFTTSISGPSLYVVGIPSSIVGVAPTPLTVVPLQCVVSVYCPSDLDSYLSDAYIIVNISMDLSREKVNLVLHVYTLYNAQNDIIATCTCTWYIDMYHQQYTDIHRTLMINN